MKAIILTFCILLTYFVGEAQVKKDTTSKPVHHPVVEIPVTDSTRMLQRRDIEELINLLQDYPAKYANPITNWLSNRYNARMAEYKAHPKDY